MHPFITTRLGKESEVYVYRGKNGDHYIEVFNNGEKRYYITKDTPQTATHTTSTDDLRGIGTYLESPNNIIHFINPNYNTQMDNNLLYGSVEMNIDNTEVDREYRF